MRAEGMVSAASQDEERQFEVALRPTRLDDFAGQPHVREQLSIAIEAAKRRGEAMDHVLLCGPPGLGKTTLAGIIAQELSVVCDQTAGPVLQKKLDLTGILRTSEQSRFSSSTRFIACCRTSKRFFIRRWRTSGWTS